MDDHQPPREGMTVLIPAYQSPNTLTDVCRELEIHVAPMVERLEVIFIDDGSADGTWDTIETLSRTYDWVRGIRLLRNFGQHNAILAGLRAAQLPLVLTIDDDLQNPPDQVRYLLAELTDDIDLVYGRPRHEPQGLLRNIASRATKKLMAAGLGPDVYPRSSAFRVFRRSLVEASRSVEDPSISIDVLLSWATRRITDVEVDFRPRVEGRSGYTFSKLLRHAVNMITGYSVRPLRVVSAFGVTSAVFGFALLAFIIGRYIVSGTEVAGFTFLAAAVTLFSGVQLLSLGVLGEYIGRIHFRSMGKPPYVIRETVGCTERSKEADT